MRHQQNTIHPICGAVREMKCTEPRKQWNIEKYAGICVPKFLILMHVAQNPKCTREDIIMALHPELKSSPSNKRPWNGWHSCVFAMLLWRDYIDYDKNFKYTITDKGTNLLHQWIKISLN